MDPGTPSSHLSNVPNPLFDGLLLPTAAVAGLLGPQWRRQNLWSLTKVSLVPWDHFQVQEIEITSTKLSEKGESLLRTAERLIEQPRHGRSGTRKQWGSVFLALTLLLSVPLAVCSASQATCLGDALAKTSCHYTVSVFYFHWLRQASVAARGIFIVLCGISHCGVQTLVVARGLVAPQWDLSSVTRGRTRDPCTGRRILHDWTTREVPIQTLFCQTKAEVFTSPCPGDFRHPQQ